MTIFALIFLGLLAFAVELAVLLALLAGIYLALAVAWHRIIMTRVGRGTVMQCQYVCGPNVELCRKTHGHRGRHRPGPFTANDQLTIGHLRAEIIIARIVRFRQDRVRWWTLRPRCPVCRAVLMGFSSGDVVPGLDPDGVRLWREFRVDPCGHSFRCYEVITPADEDRPRRGLGLIERTTHRAN